MDALRNAGHGVELIKLEKTEAADMGFADMGERKGRPALKAGAAAMRMAMTIGKLRAAAYEALIGLLFLFPVLLVLNHYVWQMTLWQSAAWLLAAYAAGIAAGGLRLRRIAQWALMAAIAAGIGFLPYGFNVGLGAIVLAGAAAAAAWAGLRHRFGHRFSLGFCAAGLLLFVAASILALVHAPFRIYGGLVYGLGLVAVAVFFLS